MLVLQLMLAKISKLSKMNFFLLPTQKVIFNFTKKIINYFSWNILFLDIETILEKHAEEFEEEDFTLEDKMPLIGMNHVIFNFTKKWWKNIWNLLAFLQKLGPVYPKYWHSFKKFKIMWSCLYTYLYQREMISPILN